MWRSDSHTAVGVRVRRVRRVCVRSCMRTYKAFRKIKMYQTVQSRKLALNAREDNILQCRKFNLCDLRPAHIQIGVEIAKMI